MNRQKQLRDIFRFRKDIRSQSVLVVIDYADTRFSRLFKFILIWDIRWRRAKIITRIESNDDITEVQKIISRKKAQQL